MLKTDLLLISIVKLIHLKTLKNWTPKVYYTLPFETCPVSISDRNDFRQKSLSWNVTRIQWRDQDMGCNSPTPTFTWPSK